MGSSQTQAIEFFSQGGVLTSDTGTSEYFVSAYVQKHLANLGYYTSKIDGDFGNISARAVMAFQESMGLEVTGVVDGKLFETLEHEHNKLGLSASKILDDLGVPSTGDPARDAFIAQALSHLGVTEVTENAGPDVNRYGGEGVAWCIPFTSFHLREVARSAGVDVDEKLPLSWTAENLEQMSRDNGAFRKAGSDYEAKVGDIILIRYDKNALSEESRAFLTGKNNGIFSTGHAETIVKIDLENDVFYTVGGNVSNLAQVMAFKYSDYFNPNGSLREGIGLNSLGGQYSGVVDYSALPVYDMVKAAFDTDSAYSVLKPLGEVALLKTKEFIDTARAPILGLFLSSKDIYALKEIEFAEKTLEMALDAEIPSGSRDLLRKPFPDVYAAMERLLPSDPDNPEGYLKGYELPANSPPP